MQQGAIGVQRGGFTKLYHEELRLGRVTVECGERRRRVSGAAKQIWHIIKSYIFDGQPARPIALATLAAAAGLSIRQVQRHIATLTAAGWLAVQSRTGQTSIFTILRPAPAPATTHDMSAAPAPATADASATHPRQNCHPTHDVSDDHPCQKRRSPHDRSDTQKRPEPRKKEDRKEDQERVSSPALPETEQPAQESPLPIRPGSELAARQMWMTANYERVRANDRYYLTIIKPLGFTAQRAMVLRVPSLARAWFERMASDLQRNLAALGIPRIEVEG